MAEAGFGVVYLVGAGPGDPRLITVRGMELLAQADVVVYDHLSDISLLDNCKVDAVLVDVGKRPGRPVPQQEINDVLIRSSASAKVVVRLKGGDPFVFGRGGEEAMALAEKGIRFEVVPGVSSAIAVPAYAGIPVTHRGLSTSVTVVTGHRHGAAADQVDWGSLAKLGGTIVVLMGVAHRKEISEKLIKGGLKPETSVAAVRWGSRGDQRTIRTTLGHLAETDIQSPSTIVVGSVAQLDLSWFESRPLFGRKIVLTRAKGQVDAMARSIRDLGGQPIVVPVIEILPPEDDYKALGEAAKKVGHYDWLVFTSANAVTRFFAFIRDARALAGVKVATVGQGTARELAKFNVVADLIPRSSVAESLAFEFPSGSGLVLLPCAKVARDVIPAELSQKGWHVDVVEAYRTSAATPNPELSGQIAESDAIVFTSSSTASNFLASYGSQALPPLVISIGPVTTETLASHGIGKVATSAEHDVTGVLNTLVELFSA